MAVRNEFSFRRDLPEGKYRVADIFQGLEETPELQAIFAENISKIKDVVVVITNKSEVGYFEKLEYAYINNGEIHIGTNYIRTGAENDIYLDMIHELVHIKQHWDGRELFDPKYEYIDRPTEIEAYKVAAEAGKRIGLNRKEISEYLAVPWVSSEDMARLQKSINL